MALPIKPPPTLVGKAAQEFYERWANQKDTTPKEVAQESFRKWKAFFAKQKNLFPTHP
jgi:hypothetical protein